MGDGKLDRLFARWRHKHDVEALGRLFDAAAPELLRIARHLSRDAAEAEDVVQATFLTAMERAERFDGERRFLPWAAGILANHARNARRKRRPHEDEERLLELAGGDDTTARAAEAEFRAAVELALTELAPAERAVVGPVLASGARPNEIATALGITPGAARVRLHRGLARLRATLPPSFAAGALVSLSAPRGLAAVRAELLAGAGRLAPPIATTAASATLGGALVTQRILIGALVAVALLGGMVAWQPWNRPGAATPSGAVAVGARENAALPPGPGQSEPALDEAPARKSAAVASPLITFRGTLVAHGTGAAVADARVLTRPDADAELVLRDESDAAGAFSFAVAPAEIETLVVEADGFATRRAPLTAWRRAEFWYRAGREDEQPDAGVQELGAITLLPAISLQARVERVEDGGPVPDAELFLFWQAWNDVPQVLEERPIGRCDELGRVVFDGALPAHGEEGDDGNLLLYAVSPKHVGWARVAPSQRGVVDGEVVIRAAAAARLDVRVQDEQGAPIAGARVSAVPLVSPFPQQPGRMRDHYPALFPLPQSLASAFEAPTDSGGHAVLGQLLRAPRFDLHVEAEGYIEHVEGVDEAALPELEVVLVSERPVTLAGRARDRSGAPLADVEVSSRAVERSAHTDAEGRWTLEWPADGPRGVLLRAELAGYAPGSLRFELDGAPARHAGLDFVLARPAPISGEVVDQHGRGVIDARLSLLRPEALAALDRGEGVDMPPELQARSDEQGRFRIDGAEEGEWLLWVQPPHPRSEWGPAPDHVPVVGGNDALRVVLERRELAATHLVVEFLDAQTGAPVDPSAVSLLQSDEYEPAAHGMPERGPGTASWDVAVPKRYTLFCALPNGSKATAEIDVAAGGEQREQVVIGAPGVLRGRIDFGALDAPERIFLIARLVVASRSVPGGEEWNDGAVPYISTRAAPDGTFTLEELVPGTWELEVRARGAWVEPQRFEVPPGDGGREHRIVAAPGAVLELTPERAPGSGWVEPAFPDEHGAWEVSSITQGSGEAPRPMTRTFPPGEVRWRVRFLDQPGDEDSRIARDQSGSVTIAAGETLRVTVPFEPLD